MKASQFNHTCLLLACLLLAGCGSDESPGAPAPEPPGTGRAVLTPQAKVLDPAELQMLTSVVPRGELVELVFSSSSPMLSRVVAGDVLIAGVSGPTPSGGLFKVENATPRDSGLVVSARTATLGDAFQELEIHLNTELTEPAETNAAFQAQSSDVGQTQQALGVTFPINLGNGTAPNRWALTGSLSIDPEPPTVNLFFDWAGFELRDLNLEFGVKESFSAVLTAQGRTSFDTSYTLTTIPFTPIIIPIPIPFPPGVLPVVLTPGVALQAGIKGYIQGNAQASVVQNAFFKAKLGYINGEFDATSESGSTFVPEPPTYQANASARAWGGPRLEVMLWGAVGPFARAEAFIEASATVEGPPPCVLGVLDAGLSATVGIDFLADYETTLFDERKQLAQFNSCSSDPNAPGGERPTITWTRSYGRIGSGGEQAKAVLQATDGTYLVVGESSLFGGVTGFAASTWALRLDALGNVMWQKAFGRTQQGLTRGAVQVPRGFLIAGTSGVIKLDSGGNPVWARAYTSDPLLEIASIAAHPDGSFVLAGFHGTTPQAWAMKLDPRGNVLWSRRYAGNEFAKIRVTSDGGYIALGSITGSDSDISLTKLTDNGDVVWMRALDNRFDASAGLVPMAPIVGSADRGFDVAEKPGGGYVVVGETYGNFPIPEPTPVGYYGTWVAEVDASGDLIDGGSVVHRAPSEGLYGGGYAVAVRPNGSSLVVGRRADTAADLQTNEDILILQGGAYSVLATEHNDAIYNGTLAGISRGMPLQITTDGGSILAATTSSNESGGFWLTKLNRTGGINNPVLSNVSGSSFTNKDAASTERGSNPTDQPVTSTPFTLPATAESTDLWLGFWIDDR